MQHNQLGIKNEKPIRLEICKSIPMAQRVTQKRYKPLHVKRYPQNGLIFSNLISQPFLYHYMTQNASYDVRFMNV